MIRVVALLLFCWSLSGTRAQLAPEVDDCTVFYREDYESAAQPDLDALAAEFAAEELARLELQHARRPNNRIVAAQLAAAYSFAGRYDEAERLIAALTAHKRAKKSDFAILLKHYTTRGQFDKARATVERFGRRFGEKRPGSEWLAAVEVYEVLTGDVHSAEDILAFPLPGDARLAIAAEFAFAQGDVAAGMLLTEALYYVGGFPAVPRVLIDYSTVSQRELLTSVAHGDGWPFMQYPAGSPRAAYAEALVVSITEAVATIGEYPSMLELHADVRLRAQDYFADRLNGEGDLVTEILRFADVIREDGFLRWISMARLRESDRSYFDALTCSETAAWAATQAYFAEQIAESRYDLSVNLGVQAMSY